MKTEVIRQYYEEQIYGTWRSGETVSFQMHSVSKRTTGVFSDNPLRAMNELSTTDDGVDVEIMVNANGKTASFTVRVYLPTNEEQTDQKKSCPYLVCMHPIEPKDYARKRGYAVIFLDTSMVAEDNADHKGCFYELYPYTEQPEEQTGVLMAWAWAASKVIDAMENGLGEALSIDASRSLVTGVSRWGKATAVCGAFESRFKLVFPTCSGAGGLALWTYQSEGKSYDLTECGGPKDYVYGQNEPLSCLQSDAEKGWFCDRFLSFSNYEEIQVEQYELPVLAADPSRYYVIVAAWMGEDWVNAPAMWACYEAAKNRYEDMGLGDHIHAHFHKEGHAVLAEDLEYVLDLFDKNC